MAYNEQTRMREIIARTFPDHGVVGEEHGRDRADAEYVWVLDPVDGTKAFLSGVPVFGTLIALMHGGKPILGIIDMPVNRDYILVPRRRYFHDIGVLRGTKSRLSIIDGNPRWRCRAVGQGPAEATRTK